MVPSSWGNCEAPRLTKVAQHHTPAFHHTPTIANINILLDLLGQADERSLQQTNTRNSTQTTPDNPGRERTRRVSCFYSSHEPKQPDKMHAPGRSSTRPPAGPRRNGQQRGRGTPPYRSNSRASSSTSSDTYTMNSDYYHRRTNSASGNYLHYQSHNMPPRRTESESILPNGSTLLPPPPGYVPPHMRSRMRNDQWKKWQEVKIKIQGLPRSVTTMDIYKMLKGEGEITRIDIDRNPGAIGRAWVTFRYVHRRRFDVKILMNLTLSLP